MSSQTVNGEPSDNLLLEQFRQGDRDALAVLVARHKGPLYSLLVMMHGAGPDVDDLFQDTWFRALRKIDSYRTDNFRAWLLRIGHNLIIDRQRARRQTVSLDAESEDADNDSGGSLLDVLPDKGSGPDRMMMGRELKGRVAAAVALLPADQKEVFLLRVQEDMPFKEIARLQGVSINTALGRMQYAIEKLRKELHDEYHRKN